MAPSSIPNDIYQYSLLSAYNAGLKEGGPPVAFLTNHGTHGVGVFEAEEDDDDGGNDLPPSDMIQLDSVTYAIDSEGDVSRAEKGDQMPHTLVTVFQPSQKLKPPAGTRFKKVRELFASKAKNTPLPFRITGSFKYIGAKQATYWDVEGTIFGFCIPEWQKAISGDGLQCCFLTKDAQRGGKVVDFEMGDGAMLEFAKCGRFHLGFPQDEEYEELRI